MIQTRSRSGQAAAVVADDYRERELQSGWRFKSQRGRVVHCPERAWPETWVEKLAQLRSLDDGVSRGLSSRAAERFGNSVVPHIPSIIGSAILESMEVANG